MRSHRFRGLQRAAADEDREPAEEDPLIRAEQVVTPGDGVAHRSLPRGEVAGAAGQQGQPFFQPRQQRGRRHDLDAGGRQLDRQWQVHRDDGRSRHRGRILRRQAEIRFERLRPRGKEQHRLRMDRVFAVESSVGSYVDRWNRMLVFSGKPKPHPTRYEDVKPGDARSKPATTGAACGDLLEVVEHQESTSVSEHSGELIDE